MHTPEARKDDPQFNARPLAIVSIVFILVVVGSLWYERVQTEAEAARSQARIAKLKTAFAAEKAAVEDAKKKKHDEWRQKRDSLIQQVRDMMVAKRWDDARNIAAKWIEYQDPELVAMHATSSIAADAARVKEQERARLAAEKADRARRKREGVAIGMTREEVLMSQWGRPEHINRTTTAHGEHEQWVYHGRNYLYFENGKLTTIQN